MKIIKNIDPPKLCEDCMTFIYKDEELCDKCKEKRDLHYVDEMVYLLASLILII